MANIWTYKRLVKAGLVNLAAASPEALVQACEQSYEARVADAARRVLKHGSRIVLLSGPSGCGKTTSANKLAGYLEQMGCRAQVISMDDFYLNKEDYPRLPDGTKDYENVTALDLALLHRCMEELLLTGKTELPSFDFSTEMRRAQTKPLNLEGGVVVMEGIHALNPLVSAGLDGRMLFKIFTGVREEYCDADGRMILKARQLRLGRRVLRDTQRSHSAEQTVLRAPQVDAGEDTYIRRFKMQANCLLDTSFSYEPCVMGALLPERLDTIPDSSPVAGVARKLAAAWRQFTPLDSSYVPPHSMLQEFLQVV